VEPLHIVDGDRLELRGAADPEASVRMPFGEERRVQEANDVSIRRVFIALLTLRLDDAAHRIEPRSIERRAAVRHALGFDPQRERNAASGDAFDVPRRVEGGEGVGERPAGFVHVSPELVGSHCATAVEDDVFDTERCAR
jgi:hypothetical protein